MLTYTFHSLRHGKETLFDVWVWWPVLISGSDGIRWHTFSHVPSLLFPSIWLLQVRISLRIHHMFILTVLRVLGTFVGLDLL